MRTACAFILLCLAVACQPSMGSRTLQQTKIKPDIQSLTTQYLACGTSAAEGFPVIVNNFDTLIGNPQILTDGTCAAKSPIKSLTVFEEERENLEEYIQLQSENAFTPAPAGAPGYWDEPIWSAEEVAAWQRELDAFTNVGPGGTPLNTAASPLASPTQETCVASEEGGEAPWFTVDLGVGYEDYLVDYVYMTFCGNLAPGLKGLACVGNQPVTPDSDGLINCTPESAQQEVGFSFGEQRVNFKVGRVGRYVTVLLPPYTTFSISEIDVQVAAQGTIDKNALAPATVDGDAVTVQSDDGTVDVQAVLDAHNSIREVYNNATALTWSDSLAASAQLWASACEWRYSGFPGVGENIAAGFYKIQDAVAAWSSEADNYVGQFTVNSGHFTQMVWKETSEVGCAIQYCNTISGLSWGGTIYVCQYNPPGNVLGAFGQNVDPSSS